DAASPEGIEVALTGTALRATTNASGGFLLEAVPPGTYELTASKPGYATVRQSLSLSAGDAPTLSLSMQRARGRLSGVITLEAASTSAGIAVTLTGTSAATTTDAEGRFVLEDLPLGPSALVAVKDGYTALQLSVEVKERDSTPVTQVLARIRGRVEGQVRLEGSTAHDGIQVSLLGETPRATTDAEGRFVLGNLLPGTYTLLAEKDLFVVARQQVVVKASEAASVTLTLPRMKGEVRGSVSRDDAGDLENGGIEVSVTGTTLRTTTSAEGLFVFTGVPTGRQEVRASLEGYAEDRQPVQVQEGPGVFTALTLVRLRGRVEGQVTLSDGASASGITVSLTGTNTRATTDAEGRFVMAGIPTGTYEVVTRKEHYTQETRSVEVTAGATATTSFLLTRLQPPTVTTFSERGVQGGRLTLTGENLDYSRDTFSVTVGGVAATEVLFRSNTRIILRLPHTVSPGLWDVVMKTEDPSRTFSAKIRVVAQTTLASGLFYALGVKPDATLGYFSGFSSEPVEDVPEKAKTGIVSVSSGEKDALALREDGTVVAWGRNSNGQGNVPQGLAGVIAIASGFNFNVALKDDGTVVAWGANGSGQSTVPEGLTDVIALSAGVSHALALKADGTVVAWGNNNYGQSTVPEGLTDVVQVSAGRNQSVARRADGSLVVWGYPPVGTPLPQGLTGVTTVALSRNSEIYGLAVTSDTSVIAWGEADDTLGTGVPPPVQANVVALVAGPDFASLALYRDGSVAAWGLSAGSTLELPRGLVLRVPAP
ncbi:carboxypeptidase regulatory-like domain-containing protein, partial [Corallococcus llansteffanensis]